MVAHDVVAHARTLRRDRRWLLRGGTTAAVAGAAGLLARSSIHPMTGAAQEATPDALSPFLDAWVALWTVDPAGAAALYAPDGVIEDVPGGAAYQGLDEINEHIEADFAAVTERGFEVRSAFIAGDHVAVEGTFSGSYTGSFPGLPPGTGQPVSFPLAALIELDDGLIRREAHYYDSFTFLVQIDVLQVPEPDAEGTPAP